MDDTMAVRGRGVERSSSINFSGTVGETFTTVMDTISQRFRILPRYIGERVTLFVLDFECGRCGTKPNVAVTL